MKTNGGKASSLSETMSSTRGTASSCCPEVADVGAGKSREASGTRSVQLPGPEFRVWEWLGIAGCRSGTPNDGPVNLHG